MRNRILLPLIILFTGIFISSCKKEVLEPSKVEPPKFFIETELDGQSLNVYSGKDNYIIAPKLDQLDVLAFFSLSLFSSNFTDGKDSLQVGFLDVQSPVFAPVLPSKAALERLLANAQANPETIFTDYPGVSIRWVKDGKEAFTSPTEGQEGSYFRISKIEDYTPPGADHAMKKVDVTFRCRIENADYTASHWLENGKATLLFDYNPK